MFFDFRGEFYSVLLNGLCVIFKPAKLCNDLSCANTVIRICLHYMTTQRFWIEGDNFVRRSVAEKKVRLYHASHTVKRIEDINFPGHKDSFDFGQGFYLTENKVVADMWSVSNNRPIVNVYEYDGSAQKLYDISRDFEAWLKIVVGFRSRAYKVNIKSDIIYGQIANDRMDRVMESFLAGVISSDQLRKALLLVNLGNQFAFKKSCIGLEFVGSYTLKGFEARQITDRNNSNRADLEAKIRLVYRERNTGFFIEDLKGMGDFYE